MASTAFDTPSALEGALDSLALLETLTDNVLLQGANLNQDIASDGSLVDVVDVYWTLPGRPGFFTTRVPFESNWSAIAFYYLGVKQALVEGIYQGLASKDELPAAGTSGPGVPVTGTPIPQPGVAVPL